MNKKNQHGFTLVELMIALALNLFVFGGLMYIFSQHIEHYKNITNINQLNEQLQSALHIMSNDIRRAGYWANARQDVGIRQNNNPFMTNATDLYVNPAGTCILLSYDKNNDGAIPAISSAIDDERYGYRLINGVIQSRPPGAPFNCDADSASWENLTNPNSINVLSLTFVLNSTTVATGPGTKAIVLRSVDISITGTVKNKPTLSRFLDKHIRIRNDKFIP